MRLVAPLALAIAAGCGGEPFFTERALPPISDVLFDEHGGDVWSFVRRVSGEAPEGCVTVEIKRGPVLLRVPVFEGRFSGVVPLSAGENVLGAFCADPPFSSRDARVVYRVRLPASPRASVRLRIDGAIVLDAVARENGGTHLPIAALRWSADPANPSPLVTTDGTPIERARGRRLELAVPERDGEYVVWLTAHDRARRSDRAGVSFVVEGGRAHRPDEPWIERAVLYGAVPLVTSDERLSSLAELGVSALWLGPVGEVDLERVRDLVERAHARGLRVLLDVAPGRTSREHPYFVHATRYGRRSPYRSLYEPDGSGRLDLDDPDARRFVVESLASLARELRVDGFRIAGAAELSARAPRLIAELRDELTRIEPRIVLLAEGSAAPPGFDAAYDPGAFRDAFEQGEVDLSRLQRALGGARVLRGLEPRAPLERVTSTLLFTAPGIPSLFEPEGGLTPERVARLRALARLRASEPALTRGRFVPLAVDVPGVYAYARSTPGARPIVIVLDFAGEARVARVRLPAELARGRPIAIFGAGGARLGRGVLIVALGPHDARVFAFE